MIVMDAEECAGFLHCTMKTLYVWCSARKIPHFNTGKKLLFDKEEVEKWLESRRVKTNEQLMEEAKMRLRRNR